MLQKVPSRGEEPSPAQKREDRITAAPHRLQKGGTKNEAGVKKEVKKGGESLSLIKKRLGMNISSKHVCR